METINKKLERFFAGYEAAFNRSLGETPDVETIIRAFADCFIAANPKGVACGKNDEQLRTAIMQGYEFYKSIGTKSVKIVTLTVTSLDDYHSLAKVHYKALYKKKDSNEELVDFDVIYLIQTLAENPKIFAYITGDEQKLLREKGLIPS